MSKKFVYGLHARPAMLGSIPSGFLEIIEDDRRARHGVVTYESELNLQEIEDYELLNLNKYSNHGLTLKEACIVSAAVKVFVEQYDGLTLEIMLFDMTDAQEEEQRYFITQWVRAVAYGYKCLTNRAAEKLVKANNGDYAMELKKPGEGQYDQIMVIIPSSRELGEWKSVLYDRLGPVSDTDVERGSAIEQISKAVRSGFSQLCSGTLDRLANSANWLKLKAPAFRDYQ